MAYPVDRKYSKEHEWALIEGKTLTVGVTDHAQSALGDIVFVELPKIGRELKQGETFGVVESIKAVSDLYSPATGKVTAINDKVVAEPSLINHDPHGDAWLIKLDCASPPADLMDSAAYTGYVAGLK